MHRMEDHCYFRTILPSHKTHYVFILVCEHFEDMLLFYTLDYSSPSNESSEWLPRIESLCNYVRILKKGYISETQSMFILLKSNEIFKILQLHVPGQV